MLYSMNYFLGRPLSPREGAYGKCVDLLFDDAEWKFRYLVANDRALFFSKNTLLAPESIARSELETSRAAIPLTVRQDQIESAPSLQNNLPVSRRKEAETLGHYNWTPYWIPGPPKNFEGRARAAAASQAQLEGEFDPHLRSAKEVLGYHVRNASTEVGELVDLIVDIDDYSVPYVAIDTKPRSEGGVRLVPTGPSDYKMRFNCYKREAWTNCSALVLLESPSADLSGGRLSIGDQQKVDLSSS